jgi:hypothetical protein
VFVFDTSLDRKAFLMLIGQTGAVAEVLKRVDQLGGKNTEVGLWSWSLVFSRDMVIAELISGLRTRQLRVSVIISAPSSRNPIVHQTYFLPLPAFLSTLSSLARHFRSEPEEVDILDGWDGGEDDSVIEGVHENTLRDAKGREKEGDVGLLDGLVAGIEVCHFRGSASVESIND